MDGAFPSDTSNTGGGWAQQGQEWTLEEDLEVMQELKNIRHGVLSHKNMTVREAEKIQHVLKVWCRRVCVRALHLAASLRACMQGRWRRTVCHARLGVVRMSNVGSKR